MIRALDLGELGETVAWVRIQGMEWEWKGRELEVNGSRDERNGGEGVGQVVVGKNHLQGGSQAIFSTSWHPVESVVPEVIDSGWAASMSLPPQLLSRSEEHTSELQSP